MRASLQMRAALMALVVHSAVVAGVDRVGAQSKPTEGNASAPAAPFSLDALIVSIKINDRVVDENSFVFRESESVWYVADSLLSASRITAGGAPEQIDGIEYRRLQSGPGIVFHYDPAAASLGLELAPRHFEKWLISAKREAPAAPKAKSVPAAFLDYDLGARYGAGEFGFDGLASVGISGSFGVAQSQWTFSSGAEPSFVRLGSSLTIDNPDRLATFIVGDAIEATAPGLAALPFGGVGWFSNFDVDPDFIGLSLPYAEGVIYAPGQVDVFIGGQQRFSDAIAEGDFRISDLSATAGAADLKIVTTDLTGQETAFVSPIYVAPDLLKPGLTAYSFAAGWDRLDSDGDGIDYGALFARAGYRRGLLHWLTINGAGEANSDIIDVSAGADFRMGALGEASLGASASRSAGGNELGYLFTGALSRTASDVSFGIGASYASRHFSQIGIEPMSYPKTRYDARASFSLIGGRLSATASFTERWDAESVTIAQLGYARKLGPGQVTLSGFHAESDEDATEFRASYTLPFGAGASATTQLVRKDGAVSASVAAGRSAPPGEGVGYSVNIDANGDGVDARTALSLRKSTLTGSIEGVRRDGKLSGRARVRSGLVFADGSLFASREAGNGAVIVETPDLRDLPVSFNHQEHGRTRKNGKALIAAQPFMRHVVSVDESALPIDVALAKSSEKFTTGRSRVAKVVFPLAQNFSQTVVIKLAGDAAPARGTPILAEGEPKPLPVGHDGLAYLTSDLPRRAYALDTANGRCEFEVDFEETKSRDALDGAWPVVACDAFLGDQIVNNDLDKEQKLPLNAHQPKARKKLASAITPDTTRRVVPRPSLRPRADRTSQQRPPRSGRYGHMAVITFADGSEPPRGTPLYAGRRTAPFAVGYDGLAFLTSEARRKRYSLNVGERSCVFDAHFGNQRTGSEGDAAWPIYVCR